MIQKFSKKELERLGCSEEEVTLVMKCQKKFPIILDNESDTKGFCIDARVLHEQLEIGKHFSSWISEKIKKYKFIENVDYLVTQKRVARKIGGTIAMEYSLTLRMSEHLCMIQNNDNGFMFRDYFCLMEELVRRNKDW